MKLSCDERTQEAPQSHVDLHDVMAALKTGMVSAHEARIASALRIDPDLSGLRALEEASGICRKSVLKVLPQAEESSTLLHCDERGAFAWEAEDRSPMVIRYRSFVHHKSPESSKTSSPSQGQEVPKEVLRVKDHEEISGAWMTGVLDPSRDIWANTEDGLGDHGWVLAMVTRFRETVFTLDELKGILRLGDRQLRRILDRMGSYVRRVKEGRRALVTVDFSWWVKADEDELAENFLRRDRRDRKAAQHLHEAEAVDEMGTDQGRRIREIWKNRREEAERVRRLLEGVPENLRHRTSRILAILDITADRRDRNWVTRWKGESMLRKHLGER